MSNVVYQIHHILEVGPPLEQPSLRSVQLSYPVIVLQNSKQLKKESLPMILICHYLYLTICCLTLPADSTNTSQGIEKQGGMLIDVRERKQI